MKMRHLQLSVDAARWPDHMLAGIIVEQNEDGSERPWSGPEVRAHLLELKAKGFEVLPCCDHTDPKTGRWLGAKDVEDEFRDDTDRVTNARVDWKDTV